MLEKLTRIIVIITAICIAFSFVATRFFSSDKIVHDIPWGVLIISLAGLSLVLMLISLFKKSSFSSLLLITALFTLNLGFGFAYIDSVSHEYFLIAGVGLIVIWLFTPNRKANQDD
jgi:hypothetical protein